MPTATELVFPGLAMPNDVLAHAATSVIKSLQPLIKGATATGKAHGGGKGEGGKSKWFSSNYTADSCPCSLGGCQSLWPCVASKLCVEADPPDPPAFWTTARPMRAAAEAADAAAVASRSTDLLSASDGGRTTFLLFLAFNSSLVRNLFAKNPQRAREREVGRILWFAHTARMVSTRLPIHVVVAGERDPTSESRLKRAGLKLLDGPMVPTPQWASKWHRLSFNKIAALSFTQFDRVIVLDNDAVRTRASPLVLILTHSDRRACIHSHAYMTGPTPQHGSHRDRSHSLRRLPYNNRTSRKADAMRGHHGRPRSEAVATSVRARFGPPLLYELHKGGVRRRRRGVLAKVL